MSCLEYLIVSSIFSKQKLEEDFTTIHKQLVEGRILKCQSFSHNNTSILINLPKALDYEDIKVEEEDKTTIQE